MNMSIDNGYLVFDTETTGLEKHDRIASIAIGLCYRGKLTKSFSTHVNPGVPMNPQASAITGITDEMLRDAPKFSEIWGEVSDLFMLEEYPLVIHNAPFDMNMLEREAPEGDWRFKEVLCTLSYAKAQRVRTPAGRHRLSDLLELYAPDEDTSNLHGALRDCEALGTVTWGMLRGVPVPRSYVLPGASWAKMHRGR